MWLAVFLFFFPLLWFALLSLKPPRLTFAAPPPLFFEPTLKAYIQTIFGGGFVQELWNSFAIAGGCTLLCMLFGIPAAYGFARFNFPGRRDTLIWLLSLRMAPPIAVLLPFYLLMRATGLVGTLTSMILINFVVNLPLFIWLLKDFFREVPVSLEESAMVDGCTRVQAVIRIALPLAAPGIVVATVFAFIFAWNEFLFALVFSSSDTQPLTVAAANFWTNVQLEWHLLAAVSTVTVLPPLLLAFLLGKYIVRGLTLGGVTAE